MIEVNPFSLVLAVAVAVLSTALVVGYLVTRERHNDRATRVTRAYWAGFLDGQDSALGMGPTMHDQSAMIEAIIHSDPVTNEELTALRRKRLEVLPTRHWKPPAS